MNNRERERLIETIKSLDPELREEILGSPTKAEQKSLPKTKKA